MEKKIYRVPVYYNVCEYVAVKASSEKDAVNFVKTKQSEMSTHPSEAYYVDDSYEVENETDVIQGYDEDDPNWARESYTQEYFDASVFDIIKSKIKNFADERDIYLSDGNIESVIDDIVTEGDDITAYSDNDLKKAVDYWINENCF